MNGVDVLGWMISQRKSVYLKSFSFANTRNWRVVLSRGMHVLIDFSCNATQGRPDPLRLFSRLSPVHLNVEGNKQNEIRRQNTATRVGGQHGARAVATDRQSSNVMREIGKDDLLIRGKVDETQV